MKKTLTEWEAFISLKWLESVGAIRPESHSTFIPDTGVLFYKSVVKYRKAMEQTDKMRRSASLEASAQAAGEFVKRMLQSNNLDSIRNLYQALAAVKNGKKLKVEGHAKGVVGSALMGFLLHENRLPANREEFRRLAVNPSLEGISSRNLARTLEYYSLNKLVRDKTGPKS